MVLKSEGKSIKFVPEPARDKKYVIVAYARLIAECAMSMPLETQQQLIAGLLELTAGTPTGFMPASLSNKSAEELLYDGAIDQTFAFDRQAFI